MFSLYVDTAGWREHTMQVLASVPGLVPVAKGNGYGFGLSTLATESDRLGCDTLAVGQLNEVDALKNFSGDVLVLMPWQPELNGQLLDNERRIATVASNEALSALTGSRHRVVVELLTSMMRFGLDLKQLRQARSHIASLRVEGYALHLPIDHSERGAVEETSNWIGVLETLDIPVPSLWVSHLSATDLHILKQRHPEVKLRPRVGTRLWLGKPDAYVARGTVLASHRVRRGQRFGYRQRAAPSAGTVVIVSGGTSHGVSLTAPSPVTSTAARAKAVALGGLAATGRSLSPVRIAGKRRWFAEPPHMQVSMIWLPAAVSPPAVGDELDVDVRMTTTTFDRLVMD